MKKASVCIFCAIITLAILLCGCGKEDKYVFTLKGNPTTGYEWTVMEYDKSVVSIESSYETRPHAPAMAGVGGEYTFTVTPLQAGETDVVLLYMRAWEGAENAIKRAVFHISVDDEMNVVIEQTE